LSAEIETARARVIELLRQERRAMHTGEIAARLGIPTHMVHQAMNVPLQRKDVWFHSSEGYSIPPPATIPRPTDDTQQRFA
jgi:predicted ArsR family transcriptional regulator